jgi:hypothetical protein
LRWASFSSSHFSHEAESETGRATAQVAQIIESETEPLCWFEPVEQLERDTVVRRPAVID